MDKEKCDYYCELISKLSFELYRVQMKDKQDKLNNLLRTSNNIYDNLPNFILDIMVDFYSPKLDCGSVCRKEYSNKDVDEDLITLLVFSLNRLANGELIKEIHLQGRGNEK